MIKKQYDRQEIFKIYLAQQLLKLGNPIVDIAKNKNNSFKETDPLCSTDLFFFPFFSNGIS